MPNETNESIQTMRFADDGRIPNNPELPLIVYRGVLTGSANDMARAFQDRFEANGWGGTWVDDVFSYHHYHSTAHEVLGVAGGRAQIQFGGEQGEVVQVKAGDAVVIPAGVGHCKRDASGDFRVVGAYPAGQDWDLRRGDPDERPEVIQNIQTVPLPQQDPVQGEDGYLLTAWHKPD